MELRPIPRSGEQLPVIGMGTWQTFDPSPRTTAAIDRLAEVLRVFFDAGGRVIDSSPMYGRAEETTGSLLDRLSLTDKGFIATKIWTTGRSAGERQLNDSLEFFHRGRLDLEQVHNLVDWRTQLALLREAKQSGRTRYIGITHYVESSFAELERLLRSEHVDVIQLPYSIGVRAAETRLLSAAHDTGTAVIVNEPFGSGSLFSSVRGRPLPSWAATIAPSWAQLFLKYVLSHPAVTCVIPATSNPEHMRDNLAAGTGPMLDREQRAKLIAAVS